MKIKYYIVKVSFDCKENYLQNKQKEKSNYPFKRMSLAISIFSK